MKELSKLLERIIQRVNINLRELGVDVTPYVSTLVPPEQLLKFYAFYGISPNHPLNFQFKHTSLAGSYFLGKCQVTNSLLYKSDIRGDELKKRGDLFQCQGFEIPIQKDEEINIKDSFLIKTLVHSFSHDLETPEEFFIRDTIATHYSNIHGSPIDGCFLGPFVTVDLTTIHDCVVGAFSYIQAGEIAHLSFKPGTVWVRNPGVFNFLYKYDLHELTKYIYFGPRSRPQGLFIDFVEDRQEAFQRVFDVVNLEPAISVPKNASLDRFAVVKPYTEINENVLVAQRAYLQNSFLGKGANAQENCYIINSRLQGNDVTAHGAKIIEADLGETVFVGFNSFIKGTPESRITIGDNCIIMPHTIVDVKQPLTIPEGTLVWGLVTNEKDLSEHSISLAKLCEVDSHFSKGAMCFEGSGKKFVEAFTYRIHHILEANGALYDGVHNLGHAQRNQRIAFNTIQPYTLGDMKGLYPNIIIQP